MITDPRGEPLLPDQPPFSARRRSIATRGWFIINPPGVFSARHPGCINRNESFSFGHRVAACPDVPQEKQTTSLQSRRAGCCRSNSVGAGGLITGGGRLCVSVTSRCNSFSTVGTSGVRAGDSTGVEVNPPVESCPIYVRLLPPPLCFTVPVGISDNICQIGLIRTAGSAWLSQTQQRSTTSLIGVSGGTLSMSGYESIPYQAQAGRLSHVPKGLNS